VAQRGCADTGRDRAAPCVAGPTVHGPGTSRRFRYEKHVVMRIHATSLRVYSSRIQVSHRFKFTKRGDRASNNIGNCESLRPPGGQGGACDYRIRIPWQLINRSMIARRFENRRMQVEPIDAGRQDRHESRCGPQSIYENTVDGEPCRRPFVPFGPMGWRSSRTQPPILIGG